MSEAERIIERCTECGLCVRECDFLKRYCNSPRELAERFEAGEQMERPEIPYSCNLCSLCEEVCPEGLNVGEMCFEVRHQLVLEGLAPLPQHQPIKEGQRWSLSESFRAALPAEGRCNRVFFPGCALSAYSPDLVIKAYEHLQKKLPGTGIVLGCCGAPTYLLGEEAQFKEILKGLEADVKSLGASEIIAACPYCLHTLKLHLPHLNPVSLYEVLAQTGIPERSAEERHTFSIHDPCSSRHEAKAQDCIRELIRDRGHKIEEIEHFREHSHCCGMGGMAFAVNPGITEDRAKRTIRESRSDLITYCGACRESLASQGAHVIHILDLLFNDSWLDDRLSPPKETSVAAENQKSLKLRLQSAAEDVRFFEKLCKEC